MYKNYTLAIVIPAHNESKLISDTLNAIPKSIDKIFVIDDGSTDNQNEIISKIMKKNKKIELIVHDKSKGPGGAIISGYKKCMDFDYTVVIGGDNQMDLSELNSFLKPLLEGKGDYAKGNRFKPEMIEKTLRDMPKIRIFGNSLISILTKISSGFYGTKDVVDGYTVISKKALNTINWDIAWNGYGYPMDFLMRVNAYGFNLIEIPRRPIYLQGERQSQIKPFKYFLKVFPMLMRNFFWRIKFKYYLQEFHPIFIFINGGILLLSICFFLSMIFIYNKIFSGGDIITSSRTTIVMFGIFISMQLLMIGLYLDSRKQKKKQKS